MIVSVIESVIESESKSKSESDLVVGESECENESDLFVGEILNLEIVVLSCQELLSQYCGVHTYILALAESSSSSSNIENRLRRLHPILPLFLVHYYLPLAHNLNISFYPCFSFCA